MPGWVSSPRKRAMPRAAAQIDAEKCAWNNACSRTAPVRVAPRSSSSLNDAARLAQTTVNEEVGTKAPKEGLRERHVS